MDNIGQDTIGSLMTSLETDLRAYNSTRRPEDADASSQETQESSPSEPLDSFRPPEQAKGFDLLRRARAWLDERKVPAKGGGNKINTEFLEV